MKGNPIRLLESGELSAAERALLEAGRATPPVVYDVAAGAARFQASLASAGAAGAGGAVSVGQVATLTKLGIVVVTALGLGVAYYAWIAQRTPPPAIPREPAATATPAPRVAPASPPSAAPAAPSNAAPAQATPSTSKPTRSAQRHTAQPRRPSATRVPSAATPAPAHSEPRAATSSAPAAPQPTAAQAAREPPQPAPAARPAAEAPAPVDKPAESVDELQGIARARMLVGRDPQAALDLLQSVARAHPHGYFVEERTALTILALVGVGQRDAAAMRAEKFLRAHPKSPFADRIRAALNEP